MTTAWEADANVFYLMPLVYLVPFPFPSFSKYLSATSSRNLTLIVFLLAFVIDSIKIHQYLDISLVLPDYSLSRSLGWQHL